MYLLNGMRVWLVVALFAGSAYGPHVAAQDEPREAATAIPVSEKPFRDSAQAFLDAYAARDADAIGTMFTEDAEFRDEFGEVTVGRQAIVRLFQRVFSKSPEAMIEEINIERTRYITSTVVLEEGSILATDTPAGPVHTSRYVALHKKGDDGVWRINTLKDFPREAQGKNEQLDQLQWLIGEWVNEDKNVLVKTSCEWSDDGNYLLRRYELRTSEGKQLGGVQRIAWDPLRRQLRSWTFDSEGGLLESFWSNKGGQWLVTSQGATVEGQPIQATATYRVVDPERIIWTISSLVVGDEMSEGDTVVLVRAAPEPEPAE